MVGRPSGCSLVKNFVVKYPHALEAEERCWPCPECPIGQGLAPQCGSIISNSTKIECTPCEVNKTYSDSHGIGSCSPCNECGLKNILQPCTPYQNRKCGKDCPKGFFLNDNEDCQAEATSMPIIGTKTTVASDPAVHNITSEHLKTTQVYNATGLSAKNSSDGEMTATSTVPIRKWETPPSQNNIANDLQRNKDKEPQTVDQTTFIVVVSLLLAVIIFEAIVIAFCWVKLRSRSEWAEFRGEKYLLLTEFEGHTVNYGLRFSPSIYGRSALSINRRGKTRGHNLQYGPGNEVSKIFITSLYLEIERAKTKFKI